MNTRKPETNPDLPLDAPTESLINAIINNDYQSALEAIENKADVNVAPTIKNDFTLLQRATHALNYKLIKLLLENDANPNILNSKNISLLEILLMPQSTDKKLIEQILDLLLCYGLNTDVKFSEVSILFHDALRDGLPGLLEAYETMLMDAIRDDQVALTLVDMGIEDKEISPRNRTDTLNELSLTSREKKAAVEFAKSMLDFAVTLQHLHENISIAVKEIREEKIHYDKSSRKEIDTALHKLPSVLVDIVSQYTLDVPKDISEKRLAQNRTLSFWQQKELPLTKEGEDKIRMVRERVSYEIRLPYFFERTYGRSIGSNSINLICDYVTGPKI